MKRIPLSLTCDKCGAKIPAKSTEGIYTCEYCKHSFRLESKEPEQAPPPSEPLEPFELEESPSTSSGGGLIIMLVVLLAVGFGAAWMFMGSSSEDGSPSRRLGGERIGWDRVGGHPIPVTIGGKEHVLGRIRNYDSGELSIRVYDSSTVEERWRTPDLGTYSDAYRAIRYAVAGDRLLVSDGRNVLRVHDLDGGEKLGQHPLTDRVEQLCPLPENGKVWVETLDKRNIVFDTLAFSGTEARQRPSICPPRSAHGSTDRGALPRRELPQVEGLDPKRRFVDGDMAVLYGARSPGTPIPVAAGFDPTSREVLWSTPVIQVDATTYRSSFESFHAGLASNRFAAIYGVGSKGWQAVALDARTGDPLWKVDLRKLLAVDSIHGFIVTDGFVYIVRTGSLEVLRASDGKLLGTVGSETYER